VLYITIAVLYFNHRRVCLMQVTQSVIDEWSRDACVLHVRIMCKQKQKQRDAQLGERDSTTTVCAYI
jgi:hypothetical protein